MKYLNLLVAVTLVSALAGADDPGFGAREQDGDEVDLLPLAGDLVDADAERPRRLKVFPAVPPTHNSVPEADQEPAESNEIPLVEKELANEIPPIEEDPEESYEVPAQSYEAPPATEAPATPAEAYEVPSVEDVPEVPEVPGESYEVPSAPAESYEVPATNEAPIAPEMETPTEAPALPVEAVHVPEHVDSPVESIDVVHQPPVEPINVVHQPVESINVVHQPVESIDVVPHLSVAVSPVVCTPVCWDECHVVEKVMWTERPTSVCSPPPSHVWKRSAGASPTFGKSKKQLCFVTGVEAGRWRRDAHSGGKKSKLALCEQRAAVPIVCQTTLVREQKIVPEKICQNSCQQSC